MLSVKQFFTRHTASFFISLTTVSFAAIVANPGYFLGGLFFCWNLRDEYSVAET